MVICYSMAISGMEKFWQAPIPGSHLSKIFLQYLASDYSVAEYCPTAIFRGFSLLFGDLTPLSTQAIKMQDKIFLNQVSLNQKHPVLIRLYGFNNFVYHNMLSFCRSA